MTKLGVGRWKVVLILLAGLMGLAAGAATALYLAWMVWPVEWLPAAPSELEPADREGYLILIAEAYNQDGNLDLARQRLAQAVGADTDANTAIARLARKYLDEGQDLRTLRVLVRLTQALGASTSEMLVYLPADRPTPTRTPTVVVLPSLAPTPTVAAQPTPTATATPAPGYRLAEKRLSCIKEGGPAQVQVIVRDEDGRELPNVRVGLAWPEGGETFYTGLQPERGEGFADASMAFPGAYRLTVLQDAGGEEVTGLASAPADAGCPAEARSVIWQVVFDRF